jgi:hypothetical protein
MWSVNSTGFLGDPLLDPVSVIASAGGWEFIVKTRTGWQFWGNWCGAGKSQQRRTYYCYS